MQYKSGALISNPEMILQPVPLHQLNTKDFDTEL
jgi:hypothetical protein